MRRDKTKAATAKSTAGNWRLGFTLVELLIVVMIIGILASLAVSVMAGAVEQSRIQRTHAMIAKIDQLIMEHYESYRTRPVPVRIAAGTNPVIAARTRLFALRALMRMELPD